MPGSPDALQAPPTTADMSRRATLMTEWVAASAAAAGAAMAATKSALVAMCFSMVHLDAQRGRYPHVVEPTPVRLDLRQPPAARACPENRQGRLRTRGRARAAPQPRVYPIRAGPVKKAAARAAGG